MFCTEQDCEECAKIFGTKNVLAQSAQPDNTGRSSEQATHFLLQMSLSGDTIIMTVVTNQTVNFLLD